MSFIFENSEWKYKSTHQFYFSNRYHKNLVKCLLAQNPNIINDCKKSMVGKNIDTIYHGDIYFSMSEIYMKRFYACGKLKKCPIVTRVYYMSDNINHCNQETVGTYTMHPECINLINHIKNQIVDKYLIPDIRDLIII